jgi:hypothetical protein
VVGAAAGFEQALRIGERFGDSDLTILGRLGLGATGVHRGREAGGLVTLDEVMVAVEARVVSPLVVGIVYCAVIDACTGAFDLRRAQAWTTALTRWCAEQPDLVPFRGQCDVHRAEILRLHGAWRDAMDIAERVAHTRAQRSAFPAVGPALYQQAELHRLHGELDRAADAYREASRWGHPPEPGLAMLRLAQGQLKTASATIARAVQEAGPMLPRSRLLPAYVDIAAAFDAPFLDATAAYAPGQRPARWR